LYAPARLTSQTWHAESACGKLENPDTRLADRFKLAMRRETEELPVYALAVSRNGPKLQKAAIGEEDCTTWPTPLARPSL
jgi:uncharacterized protein (TIGR03435 family)